MDQSNIPEPNQQQTQQNNEEAKVQEVQARKRSASFRPQFNWDIESFNEESALKNLSRLANQNLSVDKEKNNAKLYVAQFSIKSNVLNKQHIYILRGESQEWGKLQIIRKYSDFHVLRETLVKRWPGVFIPPIPEKGNIGNTQKQVSKNKLHLVSNFINRIIENQALANSQQVQVFVKSAQNQVEKNLQKLKPHSLQNLYGLYKTAFPKDFEEMNEENLSILQQKIKDFQNYFGQMKKDLANQKDQMKRLAQLRTKLTAQRYLVLQKSLPQYETTCLSWFNNKHNQKKQQKQVKPENTEIGRQIQQKTEEQQNKNQQELRGYKGIYSSSKFQSALQAYKNDLFSKDEGENDDWLIYQLFKFQLRQIQAIIQAINHYKYLDTQKKFFERNIEANKQQLEDINNKKVSLKILLLSGSEDEKKTQLANQTQILETNFKLSEQLWNAMTQHVVSEIQKFQLERCESYKRSLMKAFKKQAIYMAKLFGLYVEINKL